jgi:hypothetical protein
MTRITRTLLTGLVVVVATAGTATAAMAAYSSANATLGEQEPGYSSVNAALGGEDTATHPGDGVSSVNTLVGASEPVRNGEASAATSSPNATLGSDALAKPASVGSPAPSGSDSFEWGDALIGAGVAVGAMAMALMLAMARRRTRVEPSV